MTFTRIFALYRSCHEHDIPLSNMDNFLLFGILMVIVLLSGTKLAAIPPLWTTLSAIGPQDFGTSPQQVPVEPSSIWHIEFFRSLNYFESNAIWIFKERLINRKIVLLTKREIPWWKILTNGVMGLNQVYLLKFFLLYYSCVKVEISIVPLFFLISYSLVN